MNEKQKAAIEKDILNLEGQEWRYMLTAQPSDLCLLNEEMKKIHIDSKMRKKIAKY